MSFPFTRVINIGYTVIPWVHFRLSYAVVLVIQKKRQQLFVLQIVLYENGRCNDKHFSFKDSFVIPLPLSCPAARAIARLKLLKVG